MPRKNSRPTLARAPTRAPARSSPPAPVKPASASVHAKSSSNGSARSPPAPVKPASASVHSEGSAVDVFVSSMIQGMAISIGDAIGRAVGKMAEEVMRGPRTVRHETVPAAAGPDPAVAITTSESDACGEQNKAFQDCINSSGNDNSNCQFYMDMLRECKKGSGIVLA